MRKASLEISINAIVVLILAITILGLGLAFIKTQFGGVAKQFGQVSEEIEAQLIEKIKESGELLTFNMLRFDLQKGKDKTIYMGIRNNEDNADCFHVRFSCVNSLVGGQASGGSTTDCRGELAGENWNWFSTFTTQVIKGGEIGVIPIKVQTSGTASPGTYNARVVVKRDGAAAPPTDLSSCQDFDSATTEHGSKEFFIEVK